MVSCATKDGGDMVTFQVRAWAIVENMLLVVMQKCSGSNIHFFVGEIKINLIVY